MRFLTEGISLHEKKMSTKMFFHQKRKKKRSFKNKNKWAEAFRINTKQPKEKGGTHSGRTILKSREGCGQQQVYLSFFLSFGWWVGWSVCLSVANTGVRRRPLLDGSAKVRNPPPKFPLDGRTSPVGVRRRLFTDTEEPPPVFT